MLEVSEERGRLKIALWESERTRKGERLARQHKVLVRNNIL